MTKSERARAIIVTCAEYTVFIVWLLAQTLAIVCLVIFLYMLCTNLYDAYIQHNLEQKGLQHEPQKYDKLRDAA